MCVYSLYIVSVCDNIYTCYVWHNTVVYVNVFLYMHVHPEQISAGKPRNRPASAITD